MASCIQLPRQTNTQPQNWQSHLSLSAEDTLTEELELNQAHATLMRKKEKTLLFFEAGNFTAKEIVVTWFVVLLLKSSQYMSERNNKLEIKINKKFGKLSFFTTSELERRSGNKEIESFQYNHII